MKLSRIMDIGIVIRLRDKFSELMTEPEKKALHELITFYQNSVSEEFDDSEFQKVWELYGKKGSKKVCKEKWKRLKPNERNLIFERVPLYVSATPEIQFRKNFETYLNQKCWNDVVRDRRGSVILDPEQNIFAYNDYDRPDGFIENGRMWSAERKVWIVI